MSKPRYRVRPGADPRNPESVRAVGAPPAKGAFMRLGSTQAYEGSGYGQELAGWNPPIGAVNDDVGWNRNKLASRTRDLIRNNGWAAGGVERRVDAVIGNDLWLSAKPWYKQLGQTSAWAAGWASDVESEFKLWAEDPNFRCDVERNQTFAGMMNLAYRHYLIDEEAIGVLYFLPRVASPYATCLKIVDPDRLSNPNNQGNVPGLRDGIEYDRNGAATAYYIQAAHPSDSNVAPQDMQRWVRVPRWTRSGRPNIVHAFPKKRAGQLRGLPRLAAVLKRFKMLERYDDVELQAAALQAILATFITSNAPQSTMDAIAPATADVTELTAFDVNTEARALFHEKSNIRFNGTQIPLLAEGEDIKAIQAEHPSGNFAAFEGAVLRSVATTMGLSYEQLSGDYSQTNYSSARAALIEVWRGILSERAAFCRSFVTPIYAAWLEEAIYLGTVKLPKGAPDFYQAKAAYTACKWIGPARGWVDPLKEAEAVAARKAVGMSDPEEEAAEQGLDVREILQSRARYRQEAIDLGLPDPEPDPATLQQLRSPGFPSDATPAAAPAGPKK